MGAKTIILDIGAGYTKLGIGGNLTPTLVEPSVVGIVRSRPEEEEEDSCIIPRDHPLLFGDDAIKAQEMNQVSCRYPIDDLGGIADWPAFQMLLFYMFEKLGIDEDLSDYNLLIPRPHTFSKQDLDKLIGFLFDEIGVGNLTMHDQAALVLYTQGVETGVVVEAGEGQIRIIPVYKGHAIPKLDKLFPIGGRALSKYLIKLLRLRGYHLDLKDNRETARKLKEALCYVAMDPEEEYQLADETTVLVESFSLMNGSTISMGRERFECPEALFKPSMLDVEGPGIADLLFQVIQNADIDCRVDLYQNIILSGGSSMIPGLAERLQSRLEERYLQDVLHGDQSRMKEWNIKIQSPKSRSFLVFEGAALFADLIVGESKYWVSRREYHKHGLDSVLDKCRVF